MTLQRDRLKESLDSVPGLSATPLGSASAGLPAPLGTTPIPVVDGTSVTLPLPTGNAGLSFDNGTVTGTIPLSGGIQLDNGQVSATITNPTLTLGTGTEGSIFWETFTRSFSPPDSTTPASKVSPVALRGATMGQEIS